MNFTLIKAFRTFCFLLCVNTVFSQNINLNEGLQDFTSPYSVNDFNVIFSDSFEDIHQLIDSVLHQPELHFKNWQEEKFKYLFIIDSLLIPNKAFDATIELASKLQYKEEENGPIDTSYMVDILNIQAEYLNQRGERTISQEIREKAIQLLKDQYPKDHFRIVNTLFFYQFLFSEYEPQKSIKILHEAEAALIKMKEPDQHLERKVYSQIQKYYNHRGYHDEAKKYFNKIWTPYLKNGKYVFGSLPEEADFLYESMLFYRFIGDYSKIDQIKDNAWAFYTKFKDEPSFPKLSIAGVFSTYGDNIVNTNPKEALKAYKTALIINPEKDSYHLQYLFNVAKAHLYVGEDKEALQVIETLIPEAEKTQDRRLPFFYAMKGNIYLVQKDLSHAVEYFDLMINEMNQKSNVISLSSIDELDFSPSERFNELFMLLTMAERVELNFPDHPLVPIICFNLYHGALKILKYNLDNNTPNQYLINTLGKIIQGLNRFKKENKDLILPIRSMINTTEHLSAGYLWEKFKTNLNDLTLIDSSLLRQEDVLLSKIIALKKSDKIDKEQLIFEQEVLLENLQKEKSRRFPGYARFSSFNFNVNSILAQIPPDLIILRYAIYNDQYFLYVLKKDQIAIHDIGSKNEITPNAEKLYEYIRSPHSDLDSLKQYSKSLAESLLPKSLNGFNKILVIPDGILNYIPFEILIKDKDYLLSSFDFTYAVSLALWSPLEKSKKVNRVALFAPSYSQLPPEQELITLRSEEYDLQGAKNEVQMINKIVSSDLFIEDNATKELFKEKASQYDVLHLSMHSYLNEKDPDLSSLAFSDLSQDHDLYINELYGMNLDAELVVLSACNTGIGPDKSGNGIVSLNRAFQYAGVPSIISSLWTVPDKATSEIMSSMYRNFKVSVSKSSALRNAKLEFISKNETGPQSHPFYWAGFVLHGNNNGLHFTSLNYLYLLLLVPIILGIVFIYRNKFYKSKLDDI